MLALIGLGVIKEMKGKKETIFDIVPVDFVANMIIVATAFNINKNGLPVYHASSSQRNPITVNESSNITSSFWNSN